VDPGVDFSGCKRGKGQTTKIPVIWARGGVQAGGRKEGPGKNRTKEENWCASQQQLLPLPGRETIR